ncbi:MAG: hypothetical protein M4D85_05115 [Actinomycetota bacterium]|nr:hypothetical protein [Actinomycetota bacterium]
MTCDEMVVTMAVDDASRRGLYEQAARAMGAEAADVLMEHLPPAGWADLARRSDVEHETALLRLEIGTLRAEMTSLAGQLCTEIQTAIAAQTRWMVSVLLVLGALYTTVTILGR